MATKKEHVERKTTIENALQEFRPTWLHLYRTNHIVRSKFDSVWKTFTTSLPVTSTSILENQTNPWNTHLSHDEAQKFMVKGGPMEINMINLVLEERQEDFDKWTSMVELIKLQ